MALSDFLGDILPPQAKASQINVNQAPVIKRFLHGKEKNILRTWLFDVYFTEQKIFANVQPHHILDVMVPTYNFKQNTVVYGTVPKSYVTFDSEKQYQFSITFEDDNVGTIMTLANTFQKRILRSTGVYNPLFFQNLGDCSVNLYDSQLQLAMKWVMKDVRYLGIEDVSFAYSSSDSLKIKMTFVCDIIEFGNMKMEHDFNMENDITSMPISDGARADNANK